MCAATATVVGMAEVPDIPAQIIPCSTSFQGSCDRINKAEKQRTNRDTGVGNGPAKPREQIGVKERN